MLGVIVMVAVIFQSHELPVQRELATVSLVMLSCSLVVLVSGIREVLREKEDQSAP
jgi:hypothetical protein